MAAQSELFVINPIWSLDGEWLMVNGWDNSQWRFALVSVQDCSIIPLPWLDDTELVSTWIP